MPSNNLQPLSHPARFTGLECFDISCIGANSWAKILTDTPEIATFACVTPLCLEMIDQRQRCRRALPSKFEDAGVYQLCTRVRPRGGDSNSKETPREWTLKQGKLYWIGPKDLMLQACVTIMEGMMVLRVKRSAMPMKFFKRLISRATIRETNDEGAVECLVVAGGLVLPESIRTF